MRNKFLIALIDELVCFELSRKRGARCSIVIRQHDHGVNGRIAILVGYPDKDIRRSRRAAQGK